MTTTILRRGGSLAEAWKSLGLDRAGWDLDLRMWLVTVPAVAIAVTTVPVVQVSTAHPTLNGLWRFLAMFGLATLCSVVVATCARRVAARGLRSDLLLSCWWVAAGATLWMSAGWTAAIAGAAGAAVLLHVMVRHLAAAKPNA